LITFHRLDILQVAQSTYQSTEVRTKAFPLLVLTLIAKCNNDYSVQNDESLRGHSTMLIFMCNKNDKTVVW